MLIHQSKLRLLINHRGNLDSENTLAPDLTKLIDSEVMKMFEQQIMTRIKDLLKKESYNTTTLQHYNITTLQHYFKGLKRLINSHRTMIVSLKDQIQQI